MVNNSVVQSLKQKIYSDFFGISIEEIEETTLAKKLDELYKEIMELQAKLASVSDLRDLKIPDNFFKKFVNKHSYIINIEPCAGANNSLITEKCEYTPFILHDAEISDLTYENIGMLYGLSNHSIGIGKNSTSFRNDYKGGGFYTLVSMINKYHLYRHLLGLKGALSEYVNEYKQYIARNSSVNLAKAINKTTSILKLMNSISERALSYDIGVMYSYLQPITDVNIVKTDFILKKQFTDTDMYTHPHSSTITDDWYTTSDICYGNNNFNSINRGNFDTFAEYMYNMHHWVHSVNYTNAYTGISIPTMMFTWVGVNKQKDIAISIDSISEHIKERRDNFNYVKSITTMHQPLVEYCLSTNSNTYNKFTLTENDKSNIKYMQLKRKIQQLVTYTVIADSQELVNKIKEEYKSICSDITQTDAISKCAAIRREAVSAFRDYLLDRYEQGDTVSDLKRYKDFKIVNALLEKEGITDISAVDGLSELLNTPITHYLIKLLPEEFISSSRRNWGAYIVDNHFVYLSTALMEDIGANLLSINSLIEEYVYNPVVCNLLHTLAVINSKTDTIVEEGVYTYGKKIIGMLEKYLWNSYWYMLTEMSNTPTTIGNGVIEVLKEYVAANLSNETQDKFTKYVTFRSFSSVYKGGYLYYLITTDIVYSTMFVGAYSLVSAYESYLDELGFNREYKTDYDGIFKNNISSSPFINMVNLDPDKCYNMTDNLYGYLNYVSNRSN